MDRLVFQENLARTVSQGHPDLQDNQENEESQDTLVNVEMKEHAGQLDLLEKMVPMVFQEVEDHQDLQD